MVKKSYEAVTSTASELGNKIIVFSTNDLCTTFFGRFAYSADSSEILDSYCLFFVNEEYRYFSCTDDGIDMLFVI